MATQLAAHKGLDGFSKNFRFIHMGASHFQDLFEEGIVDSDGGMPSVTSIFIMNDANVHPELRLGRYFEVNNWAH